MLTNCEVTLYTRTEGGEYTRTKATAFWSDRRLVKADKLVVSIVNGSAINIPILGNPALHIAPKDYIVRGACEVEPPTDATLGNFIKESGARSISDAHCLNYGSLDMQHWELEAGT